LKKYPADLDSDLYIIFTSMLTEIPSMYRNILRQFKALELNSNPILRNSSVKLVLVCISFREEISYLVIFLIVYSSQRLLKVYRQRPIGVTIIALLAILGGIAFLASGLGTLILIPLIGIFIGSGLLILGLAYFLMAYGLWKGRSWAWTLTLILSGIGIIVGIGSIIVGNIGSIFHIIINAIVIYYLYRPNVKSFFNK
jgi:hypothetical protein